MKTLQKNFVRGSVNALLIAVLAIGLGVVPAQASSTPNLTQTINAGSLSTDIMDSTHTPVGSPAFAFSAVGFSFNCQSGGSAATGTLGSDSQRIYVTNGSAANNGWTLAIAATSGATTTWSDGGSNTYDFNDGTTSGCGDGADADTKAGQLTLNPTAGTITTDCTSCNTTGITAGSQTSFAQGTTDSITLITAGATSSDIGRWYMTGVTGSQTIPAEQPSASYTLNMTLTVTAS